MAALASATAAARRAGGRRQREVSVAQALAALPGCFVDSLSADGRGASRAKALKARGAGWQRSGGASDTLAECPESQIQNTRRTEARNQRTSEQQEHDTARHLAAGLVMSWKMQCKAN